MDLDASTRFPAYLPLTDHSSLSVYRFPVLFDNQDRDYHTKHM